MTTTLALVLGSVTRVEARARAIGYDQPLRSGESGDEAEGPRTGRSQVSTDQAATLEARHRSVGLARFSVIGSTGGAPNIGGNHAIQRYSV